MNKHRTKQIIIRIVLITVSIVLILCLICAYKILVSNTGIRTYYNNVAKAKDIYMALLDYAKDNEGHFPKDLNTLVEEKRIESEDLYYQAETSGFSEKLEPWVYQAPLSTSSRSSTIIFNTSSPIWYGYLVIHLDGSVATYSREEYKQELEKTKQYIAESLKEAKQPDDNEATQH